MADNFTAKIEFSFIINYPEIGTEDNSKISIDLSSHPGLENIIGNFYYFLLKIGMDKKHLKKFINLEKSEEETFEEDDDYEEEDILENEETYLKEYQDFLYNSTSKNLRKSTGIPIENFEESLEKFLNQLKENKDFQKQVFEIFLSSINKDN